MPGFGKYNKSKEESFFSLFIQNKFIKMCINAPNITTKKTYELIINKLIPIYEFRKRFEIIGFII